MGMYFNNNIPIYIQLVEIMENKIISGNLKPGDRIPSVRELALKMKVNPNTMQKALTDLEELGLIYTERTNGKFVTNDTKIINKYKQLYAKQFTRQYFMKMDNIGFSKEEVINYIKGEE